MHCGEGEGESGVMKKGRGGGLVCIVVRGGVHCGEGWCALW